MATSRKWQPDGATIWKWVERVSWVWIVFGIPLFFYEHYQQVARDKAAATLDFVKRFQDYQLVTERFALLAPWMKLDIETFMAQKPSPAAVEDLVLKTIDANSESAGRRDMREPVFSIVDFYETLQLCIEADKCDRALAASYFGEYAHKFYCLYLPYIAKLRRQQNMPTYAARLENVVVSAGKCD
jgi:hypothetical protein